MRVSFVSAPLAALGAQPEPVGEALVVLAVPGEDPNAAVTLTDCSPFARTGFKGADTPAWLAAQGVDLPEAPNQARRQADGALVARLSAGEVLILDPPGAALGLSARLTQAWGWEAGLCFPVPRQDTHAWFRLAGPALPALMAKLCAVDLRPRAFADGAVAQTSVARHSAIVVRDGGAFHLLADSASAETLWGFLGEALGEFGGGVTGARGLVS
ncbi:sarcosine oxidase subunit gamma [Pararhodospirillum photometricum]|uniref:Putative sarcosine oxidase gamma subunit protein (SoxG) n=1 Tax=Pararhodospirillum photometricum DSM 122 TaxID=1150469 RepID=H6SLR4_PARPM|nr:Putative sarcosine oxidase gamma subunit protein (SoxG) [Pararhodospirillum photometricum]CCG08929.1 Putative sarcosine oxidase gamma subunit protein (SoxG) [Pararhodospirillum photometricum DSM 122]